MSLLGNKKKKKADEVMARTTTDDTSVNESGHTGGKMTRAEAKRAKDSLGLVIDETEPGAALDLIKTNTNWILPDGSGVILALPVDVPVGEGGIGGLGQVSAKGDEAKGSILERIQADSIQVLETADMLAHNILGVIPTEQTLGADGMAEYTLFDKAIFMLTSVHTGEDGSLIVEPVHAGEEVPSGDIDTVTIAQAQAVSSGAITLASLIPSLWARLGGESSTETGAAGTEPETESVAEATDAEPVSSPNEAEEQIDNLPDYDPDDVPDEPLEDDLPSEDDGVYDSGDDEDPFADLDEPDETPMESQNESEINEPAVVADDRVFDNETVQATMARRFLDEDLGLVVDMTPFEAVFGPEENASVGFATDHLSDGWLDNQMRMLSQQANADLAARRKRDIAELRERFFSLVSGTGDEIAAQMSTERGADTVWARTIAEAEDNASSARAMMDEAVDKQHAAMIKEYEEARQRVVNAEADQAGVRYDDRHKSSLNRRLADIESGLKAGIDEDLSVRRREILDTRRRSAQAAYDAAITQAMNWLIEKRSEQVADETELMDRYRAQMQAFLDENRKEDIARSQALSEELSRHNIVEEERAAHAAREKELHELIDREQVKTQEALAAARRDADELVERLRADYERQLGEVQVQVKTANERAKDMATQVEYVRTSTVKQFETQIESLESDKQVLMAQMDRESVVAKRANRLYIALAVLVALAFLAVGVITGLLLHDFAVSDIPLMGQVLIDGMTGGGIGV